MDSTDYTIFKEELHVASRLRTEPLYYEPLKPLKCNGPCGKLISQYVHTNFYGGICFDCDCDANFERYNKVNVSSLPKK